MLRLLLALGTMCAQYVAYTGERQAINYPQFTQLMKRRYLGHLLVPLSKFIYSPLTHYVYTPFYPYSSVISTDINSVLSTVSTPPIITTTII